jgi:hypothetical protein
MHVALVWRLATVVAIACSATARPCGAQVVDWSGQWSSRSGRDVEVLRNVHVTPAGWDGFAGALARDREYSISIAQTAGDVVVTFPGGVNNMLTVPAFALDAASRTDDRDS